MRAAEIDYFEAMSLDRIRHYDCKQTALARRWSHIFV